MTIDATLAVVIVNYGAADFIIEHLSKTLDECDAFTRAHIYIADNASPEDDLSKLVAHVDRYGLTGMVTVFTTGGNLGFAGGNNAAFERFHGTPPDYVFFLNPDAWPTPGSLRRMAQTLIENPKVAIVGPRIVDETNTTVISYFHFPQVLGQFSSEIEVDFFQGRSGWKVLDLDMEKQPIPMDWVSGAAFMVRMTAAPSPPMDDGYFLYFEETDMMRTVTDNGWGVLLEPRARVLHIGGLTTGAGIDPRKKPLPRHWYQSWARYFVRNKGRIGAMAAAFFKSTGILVYYLKSILMGRAILRPQHFLRDFLRYAVPAIFTISQRDRDQD